MRNKVLEINNKNLEGKLDLSDFINLRRLECFNNELTSLNVDNCSKLERIYCRGNKLTNLAFIKRLNNLEFLK